MRRVPSWSGWREACGGQRGYAEDERRREAGEPVIERKPRASVRYDADGDLLITLRLPAAPGQVLLAALEAACADLDADTPKPKDSSAEESRPPRASKGAGFLRLAKDYLNQRAQARPKRARRDRAKLACHVDPLSGWVRLPDGELLPANVAAHEGLTMPGWHQPPSASAPRSHPLRRGTPPAGARPAAS